MKFYTIGDFSKTVGKTVQTVRSCDKTGYLKPHHILVGGHRIKELNDCDNDKEG